MDTTKILIINGPNLNMLGTREPGIYGNQDFLSYFESLKTKYNSCEFAYFQTNFEGSIIEILHAESPKYDAVIINAGAYTHTSIAIRDAITTMKAKVIEVHISNVFEREQFRHHSYLSQVCLYTIIGKGLDSYDEAVKSILSPPKDRAVKAIISGKVQGVWFRYSTQKEALKLKIKGEVSNQPDGTVLVKAVGSSPNIETFIAYLHAGPEHADVSEVIVTDIEMVEKSIFRIKR